MNNFRIPTFKSNYVFNKEDALRQEQERIALENERKGLQYNPATGTWPKPVVKTPQPRPDSYWNTVASQYGFKDMQAVKDWQSKNGLIADGKFGKNSLDKWNALQSAINKQPVNNEEVKQRSCSQWDYYQPSTFTPTNETPDKSTAKSNPVQEQPVNNEEVNKSTAKSNPVQATVSRYTMNNTVGGDFGIGRGLRNMASNFLNWINDVAANTQTTRNRAINVQGRYQQGGKLEDGQKAFVAYLIQVSGAQSEQELNDFIQSLGEDGLKQQYQQFVQTMQNGTQSAKKGAKLNYIKSLRGICPEGYELGYFKEGGQICAKCVEKREKMGGIPFRPIQGEKGTKVVQDFKKDLKNKKDKIKMSKKSPEKKENGGLVEKKAGIPIKEKYIDKDKCGKKMKKKK